MHTNKCICIQWLNKMSIVTAIENYHKFGSCSNGEMFSSIKKYDG